MPLSQLDDSLVGTGSEANNVAAVVAARRCNLLSHWIADQHNFCTPNHKRFHKTYEMFIYIDKDIDGCMDESIRTGHYPIHHYTLDFLLFVEVCSAPFVALQW